MEGIGQQILNHKLREEENLVLSSSSQPEVFDDDNSSNNLYLETTLLSQIITENKLNEDNISECSDDKKKQISTRVSTIIEQLNSIGKGPSLDIGKDPRIVHVYRVLSYALLLLQKCGAPAKLQQKCNRLEKENAQLQKKYDALLQSANDNDSVGAKSTSLEYLQKMAHDSDNFSLQGENKQLTMELEQARKCLKKSDKLVSYLISRFGLPQNTNISNILSQIYKVEGVQNPNGDCANSSDSSSDAGNLSQTFDEVNLFKKQIQDLTNQLLEANEKAENYYMEKAELLPQIEQYKQELDLAQAQIRNLEKLNDNLNQELFNQKQEMTSHNEKSSANGAKVVTIEADLHMAQSKCKELEQKVSKIKEKNNNLTDQLSQVKEQLSCRNQENQKLKISNDKLQVSLDELETKLQALEKEAQKPDDNLRKDKQIQQLQSALDEVSSDLEHASNDLRLENEIRNKLTAIIQQYDYITKDYEEKLQQMKQENQTQTQFSQELQEKFKALQEQYNEVKCDHKIVAKELLNYLRNKLFNDKAKQKETLQNNTQINNSNLSKMNDLIEQNILILSNDGKEVSERVIEAFSTLLEHLQNNLANCARTLDNKQQQRPTAQQLLKNQKDQNDMKALAEKNRRLSVYLENLLHFMEQICDSGEIQEWLIGVVQPEDFRQRLSAQVLKVGSFLKNNSIVSDEENENSAETLCDTYAHFPIYLKKFFDESDLFKSPNSDEQLFVIHQFAFANRIITKFAEELQNKGIKLIQQKKELIEELNRVDETVKDKVHEATKNLEKELQQVSNEKDYLENKIENIRQYLRSQLAQGSHSSSNVSDGNDSQNDSSEQNLDELPLKCLRIINGVPQEEEEEDEYEYEEEYDDGEVNSSLLDFECDNRQNDSNSELFSSNLFSKSSSGLQVDQSPRKRKKVIRQKQTNKPYVEVLEEKLAALNEKLQNERHQYQEEREGNENIIQQLRENNKQYAITVKNQLEQINTIQEEIDEKFSGVKEENETLQKALEQQNQQNKDLTELVQKQKEHIDSFAANREQEVEQVRQNIQKEYQEQFDQLQTEIDKLKSSIEKKEKEHYNVIKNIQKSCKAEIKKKEQEKEDETQRNEELKRHYESLLQDLNNKLKAARSQQSDDQDRLQQIKEDAEETKQQNTQIVVENKMLKMKLNASQEKLEREKSMLVSQFNMTKMKLEADYKKQYEDQMLQLQSDRTEFLTNICQLFVNFVDFNKPINEDSVIEILDKVSEVVNNHEKKDADLSTFYADIDEIRTLLNITDKDSIKNAISQLISRLHQYEKAQETMKEEQEQTNKLAKSMKASLDAADRAKEWEEWATRVHGVVTDNFTITKDPNLIRYSLEEALMNSIGQRQLWRRMEILRAEKNILVKGKARGPVQQFRPTLITVLSVIVSCRRMMKLSGHLRSTLSLKADDCLLSLVPRRKTNVNSQSGRRKSNRAFV